MHEIGTRGKGVLADHAVAYPRRGGTSFWTRVPEGVEEWLHLEASAVRAGEAVAAWQIDDMTSLQRGDRVEIVDALGVVRLSVAAPVAYAAEGKLPCASVQDASANEIHFFSFHERSDVEGGRAVGRLGPRLRGDARVDGVRDPLTNARLVARVGRRVDDRAARRAGARLTGLLRGRPIPRIS
ncbi:hypothetical protein [Polyangium aurulentum]|uniref:hypothetical protein n=1 Tax=Polyangium aurulentum TaxID=2567896 RepID=UPI0010ADFA36|nr:hypothetical protein [Polyangium aurulentum]UQA63204.1 hypothetical protein E8A73_023160 [Polyangium aurulentum]